MKNRKHSFSTYDISDREVLEKAAEIIENEIEIDIIRAERKAVEVPQDLDEKILAFARKADEEAAQADKKMRSAKILRTVVAVLICAVGITALGMTTSEAFRQRMISLIYNDESGSVQIETEEEKTIINSWSDFWYPSYVPENMEIEYFDEEEHLINYSSKTDDSFLIIEEFDLDTSISYDTDTTEGKIVEVGDTDGYYFEDNTYKNYGILINMSDRYVSITCSGDWSEEEVMKIAEKLVYIE